jgi:hypothetical protein
MSNNLFLQNVWGAKLLTTLFSKPHLARITALSIFLTCFWEIGEKIGSDLRQFLHKESFQILDILCLCLWTAFFNSKPRFKMGFKSRDWCWFCGHLFADFDVCVGLLSYWKIHLLSSFNLLTETTRCLAKMSWYWVKFMMSLTLKG